MVGLLIFMINYNAIHIGLFLYHNIFIHFFSSVYDRFLISSDSLTLVTHH